jgi:hypothetical protein
MHLPIQVSQNDFPGNGSVSNKDMFTGKMDILFGNDRFAARPCAKHINWRRLSVGPLRLRTLEWFRVVFWHRGCFAYWRR